MPNIPHSATMYSNAIWLRYAVFREASGEGFVGQRAVYDVIKNRCRQQGKGVFDIVSQRRQFSWYRAHMKPVVDDKKFLQNWNIVVNMKPVIGKDVMWFHSGTKPVWAFKMKRVKVVQGHHFYILIKEK